MFVEQVAVHIYEKRVDMFHQTPRNMSPKHNSDYLSIHVSSVFVNTMSRKTPIRLGHEGDATTPKVQTKSKQLRRLPQTGLRLCLHLQGAFYIRKGNQRQLDLITAQNPSLF